MRACVLGAGSFGTALATVLAKNCKQVVVWGRDDKALAALARKETPPFLPGVKLPANLEATSDLAAALAGSGVVVCAVPSDAVREVITAAAAHLPVDVPVVSGAKGIEADTLLTLTQVMETCLPERHHPYLAALSGPSFALEIARELPTVVTIAAHWDRVAKRCQEAFQTATFRPYASPDVIGVQIGGALKNVIAIAAGMADGMSLGHNARAAIITRGLAEITRVAVRMGANPLTLSGLSGMGDLVLTCTGELSRNRRVGFELGRGRPLAEVMGEMTQVVEGIKSARSAKQLSDKLAVELPICTQVYAIAYEGKSAKAAVGELMGRQLKSELV